MMRIKILINLIVIAFLISCSGNKLAKKGFSVNNETETDDNTKIDGISQDTIKLETRPSSVLLTGNTLYRLTTVYKINYNKKKNTTFIGTNYFHSNYTTIGRTNGNQWNNNFMPGLEAVYGYNMVNISLYDIETKKQKNFFKEPVLIKTLYYPSFSSDTLNYRPVKRNYYMVSVYDEDTNNDGFINVKDLRRFYYFDINAENKKLLIPKKYSVFSSEYDPANDFMYVFAQLDKNENGKRDEGEDIHVFWIDLKNPKNTGKMYWKEKTKHNKMYKT